MHWQQPHTSCQQIPANIFAAFLCQDKGQVKYSGISHFYLRKETRSFYGLKLGLLQYKYHLANNTLQANNYQVGWTDLLQYVEISLPPIFWYPWRLGPSAFHCLSFSQPQPSLCSHFWRKRLSLPGRARARARQAGSLPPLFLQGKQAVVRSAPPSRHDDVPH